jgi:GNAT superfamily N-acetyltransferase
MAGGSVETRVRTMPASREGTLQRSAVEIREFQPEDYPAIVEISNLLLPDHPTTVGEERFEDERFDRAKMFHRRLVAVDPSSRAIVGDLLYNHTPWAFDQDRYGVWIGVHPRWQRRGIGRLLATRLMDELRERRATALRMWVRESKTETVAWLGRRGVRELHRNWESRLDVQAFDPSRFTGDARVPEGLDVVTLADELAKDPARLRDVFELDNVLSRDVPRVDPYTPPPFEMFRDFVVSGPRALPEGFFLAKDRDTYVGVSNLEKLESLPDTLYTGFTGVRREYRGRGIAMCLKLRAIDYARRRGFRWIRTANSTLNAPMLGINMKLGFVKENIWIVMGKDLTGA